MYSKAPKSFFGLAVAGVTLASVVTTTAPAAAVVVTVGGQNYTVDALPAGSFNSQQSLLGSQPWWGNQSLARQFASAVNSQLGLPNNVDGPYSPFFSFSVDDLQFVASSAISSGGNLADFSNQGCCDTLVFATATATPVPLESDGWAILISTTALGLGVKLKQLKNQKKIDLKE